jgi:hypothetical protein
VVHDIPENTWTPRRVGAAIAEAVGWAQSASSRVGPAGYRSGMPALQMTADERELEAWLSIQEHEPEPMRRGYAPSKVSQMERILAWPMEYLRIGDSESALVDDFTYCVFKAWLHSKVHRRIKFDKVCEQMGWPRSSAYRARDRVLSEISQALTRAGIERGRH